MNLYFIKSVFERDHCPHGPILLIRDHLSGTTERFLSGGLNGQWSELKWGTWKVFRARPLECCGTPFFKSFFHILFIGNAYVTHTMFLLTHELAFEFFFYLPLYSNKIIGISISATILNLSLKKNGWALAPGSPMSARSRFLITNIGRRQNLTLIFTLLFAFFSTMLSLFSKKICLGRFIFAKFNQTIILNTLTIVLK